METEKNIDTNITDMNDDDFIVANTFLNRKLMELDPEDGPAKNIRYDNEIPEWEQKYVRRYVKSKELNRPQTGLFSMIFWLFFFASSALGITAAICGFYNLFIQEYTTLPLISLETMTPIVVIFVVSLIVVMLCFIKTIAIGLIHFYQRLSPEELRRACLFKPTCSEFAIMAINKYGLFKALPKISDRFSRCHGEVYRIDYP